MTWCLCLFFVVLQPEALEVLSGYSEAAIYPVATQLSRYDKSTRPLITRTFLGLVVFPA